MPHIPDAVLDEMLKQMPADQARSLANIAKGKITHQVRCMGEDTYATVTYPVFDNDNNRTYDEDGKEITEDKQELGREGCKGEVIAYVYIDGVDAQGRIKRHVEPAVMNRKMKLRSYRKRFDGQLGFKCICGNNSIVSRQELGHISPEPPTRDDLKAIYAKLQKDPADYPEIDGKTEVDGFTLERVN
jgi:hypothetical protein